MNRGGTSTQTECYYMLQNTVFLTTTQFRTASGVNPSSAHCATRPSPPWHADRPSHLALSECHFPLRPHLPRLTVRPPRGFQRPHYRRPKEKSARELERGGREHVPVEDSQNQEVPEEIDDLQREDGSEDQRLDPMYAYHPVQFSDSKRFTRI